MDLPAASHLPGSIFVFHNSYLHSVRQAMSTDLCMLREWDGGEAIKRK